MANSKLKISKNMSPYIMDLEAVEAGEIYQAIFRYACYGEDTDFSGRDRLMRFVWKITKEELEEQK